ncbi:hypothetical protein EYZ11_010711 [Aspergillus tanneri]|uniref:Xylanolytic transcriptional activator regulatory domain-containing protein n=1 Tax=Aspergillus tanneri TaxID=1220188 RepID=A0A4S3J6S9_9EURO|nr:uncharacterized protein ATNIH1004_007249 [Aspergillus tanneri]KAA8645828.1 hypothetical protein ATNIH1004_007249 [Aspergillus tanneri]THC89827.1 hypothetical protein EYZ11_010711 [Aspergillus tanneri]
MSARRDPGASAAAAVTSGPAFSPGCLVPREYELWDVEGNSDSNGHETSAPTYLFQSIERDLSRMPHRQMLDFLVQYFVYELNWMKQVIHAPSFLAEYQQWWTKDQPFTVPDIEFAVLILRVSSYAAQFLPAPSHTVGSIGGLSLTDIRNTCSEVGDSLAQACLSLDWKGSLVRVQHTLFLALKFSCECRTDRFWEGIASSSRAAQKAGIHADAPLPGADGAQNLEKEMERRTLCSLYVLDSHLSRQLDRIPFLPDDLVAETLPRLRLVPDIGSDASAPDIFTERLMQVQLGRFWRSFGPRRNVGYDPMQGEQRYEKFCAEYLPTLSPAFALEPDTQWDARLPKLPMQRQLLHIAIFDSICWNFRPLLLLKPAQIARLVPYKQVLLQSQKKRLALAALVELEAVTTLHAMFGGSHTRFAAIIFNTFEAAVLLLGLCGHRDFPFDQGDEDTVILGVKAGRLTRGKALQAAEQALRRLQMLAEVSEMAATGAHVVTQLFIKATQEQASESVTPMGSSGSSSWPGPLLNLLGLDDDAGNWASAETANPSWMSESIPKIAQDDSYSVLQESRLGFAAPWAVGDPL